MWPEDDSLENRVRWGEVKVIGELRWHTGSVPRRFLAKSESPIRVWANQTSQKVRALSSFQ